MADATTTAKHSNPNAKPKTADATTQQSSKQDAMKVKAKETKQPSTRKSSKAKTKTTFSAAYDSSDSDSDDEYTTIRPGVKSKMSTVAKSSTLGGLKTGAKTNANVAVKSLLGGLKATKAVKSSSKVDGLKTEAKATKAVKSSSTQRGLKPEAKAESETAKVRPKRKAAIVSETLTRRELEEDEKDEKTKRRRVSLKSEESPQVEADFDDAASVEVEAMKWSKQNELTDDHLDQINEVLKLIGEGSDAETLLKTFLCQLKNKQCKAIMNHNGIKYPRMDDGNKDGRLSSLITQIKSTVLEERLLNQANSIGKRKAKAKLVSADTMLKCVVIVEKHLNRITHYTIEDSDGRRVDLDRKFIEVVGEGYEFNVEEFEKSAKEVPNDSLLSTIMEVRPDQKYLTQSFPRRNGSKHPTARKLIELLNEVVGPETVYQKDEEQIRAFLLNRVMPKIRPIFVQGEIKGEQREHISLLEKHIELNEALPNRGLNSFIDNWESFQKEVLSLVTTNQVASSMSLSDSIDFVKGMLEERDHFNRDDAERIMGSSAEEYVLFCMNQVKTDRIAADNERAIQDAQNVRGKSGANVWVGSHGTALVLSEGASLGFEFKRSSEYPDGRKGCLGKLPTGEVFNPLCIGALVKAYQAGRWTEEDYEKYGPNLLIEIQGTYLYDYWGCRLFRVFKQEELFHKGGGSRMIPGGFFRDSIVGLGDGYFIGMFPRPKMQLNDGLPTYSYIIATKEGSRGRTNMKVHQMTEMMKRELQLDSRGQLAEYVACMLGHPGETPEEIFPVVGRNWKAESGFEYESRLDFIPYKDQNEIGDVEHPGKRDKLEDNGCECTFGTNHSNNATIGTTQYHATNGTGDHNFAHLHSVYKKNSIDVGSKKLTKYRHKMYKI